MKKIYLKPEMEIVEINVNQQILAGSTPALGDDFTEGDPVLAPSDEDIIFGNSGINFFEFWLTQNKTQSGPPSQVGPIFFLLTGLEPCLRNVLPPLLLNILTAEIYRNSVGEASVEPQSNLGAITAKIGQVCLRSQFSGGRVFIVVKLHSIKRLRVDYVGNPLGLSYNLRTFTA